MNFLEYLFQSAIDPKVGLKKEQALDMAKKLGFKDKLADEVCSLYKSDFFTLLYSIGYRSNYEIIQSISKI